MVTRLPLVLRLANTDPAFEVVHDSAQVLDQRLLFRLDHRNQLLVIGPAAAWAARWERRERSGITATQLTPQTLDAADAWRLLQLSLTYRNPLHRRHAVGSRRARRRHCGHSNHGLDLRPRAR